jgi:molybdate-binding protein
MEDTVNEHLSLRRRSSGSGLRKLFDATLSLMMG